MPSIRYHVFGMNGVDNEIILLAFYCLSEQVIQRSVGVNDFLKTDLLTRMAFSEIKNI